MPMNWKHATLFVSMLGLFMLAWWACSWTIKIGGRVLDLKKINIFSMSPMNSITSAMGVYIGASIGACILLFALFTVFATQIGNWVSRRLMKTFRLEDKA